MIDYGEVSTFYLAYVRYAYIYIYMGICGLGMSVW